MAVIHGGKWRVTHGEKNGSVRLAFAMASLFRSAAGAKRGSLWIHAGVSIVYLTSSSLASLTAASAPKSLSTILSENSSAVPTPVF
tara:strand:+ start:769 stop:1026 length:258 start_codon:yes stop_codon:yes gene_type:complete